MHMDMAEVKKKEQRKKEKLKILHQVMDPSAGLSFIPISISLLHLSISDLLLYLRIILLIHSHGAQSELICSHQPIVALAGDDVILPCRLEPAISARTVEWTKPGLDPKYIHIHKEGLKHWIQNPSYNFRTRVFVDELEQGNVSMKIFSVKLSDQGKYRCYIHSVQEEAFIHLSVGSVSSPVIKVTANTGRTLVLQCESKGWHPEPELLWLDGEGKLLSAGRTKTIRGPDDLYTVRGRVTVEKRHSNNFTCRVQQKIINQTRETQIHVPGGFIKDPSEDYLVIIGILMLGIPSILLLVVFLLCRLRSSKISTSDEEGQSTQLSELTTGDLTR
ncbi:butyrophilin subfamily 1 member A1-like [Seriola lalandi dorsalis]|uniref:butyrophilin subfamily 1 member A1-like n=1 Tax=Seriola lalandi dorsalis TaxID=1841481 RepID=UPI000C6F8967|nr:butyrophilin subfamily 1 member A1-like [Seriola lalandi dorsalis]